MQKKSLFPHWFYLLVTILSYCSYLKWRLDGSSNNVTFESHVTFVNCVPFSGRRWSGWNQRKGFYGAWTQIARIRVQLCKKENVSPVKHSYALFLLPRKNLNNEERKILPAILCVYHILFNLCTYILYISITTNRSHKTYTSMEKVSSTN